MASKRKTWELSKHHAQARALLDAAGGRCLWSRDMYMDDGKRPWFRLEAWHCRGANILLQAWPDDMGVVTYTDQGTGESWDEFRAWLDSRQNDRPAGPSGTAMPEVRAEHQAWRELCAELVKTGAVTPDDLAKPVNHGLITPGLRLLDAIRAWGELRAALIGKKVTP